MKQKIVWVVIAIVVLAVIVFSFRNLSPKTIKIVALYPLTGGVASYGESSKNGTQLAVEEINKNGGINGKTLEVVYEDHKCDPKTALSAYQASLLSTKIFLSSSCSGTVLSIAPNLQKDNAILLATVTTSGRVSSSSPLLFRNWPVDVRQAYVIAQKIKELGYKNIAIIYEETDYGKGLDIALKNFLKDSDITITEESFASASTDVKTQLTKLKATHPDALFIAPQTETSTEIVLKQMEQINFNPKLFVNDLTLGAASIIVKHKALLEGAIGGNFIMQPGDALQKFIDSYKLRFGTECPHIGACVVAYDSVYMLAEAIAKNGNSTQGIQQYLQQIKYNGISGLTSFDSANDRDGVGYLPSVIKNGVVELIK
jgi:branched-chain amino acid transport system substrate-binding protein